MGEKSGGLTNMIIVLVALVAIIFIVQQLFPDLAETITDKMKNIIENPGDVVGTIFLGNKFL